MSKNLKNPFRRIALISLIACFMTLVVLTGTIHVWAAYTAFTHRSRTLSTWKDTGSFFTSNYLHAVNRQDDVTSYTTIVVGGEGTRLNLAVYVCNYNRMAVDSPITPENITYRFQVTVCGMNKEPLETMGATWTWEDFTVDTGDGTVALEGNTRSIEKTLIGKSHQFHVFNVSFPAEFDGYLLLEAIPANDSDFEVSNQTKLGCFATTSLDRSLPNAWTGKLTGIDNLTAGTVIDGFNYEISGSGVREYTLSWDTSHIELSQWNILKYDLNITVDGTIASTVLSLPFGEEDDLFHTYEWQFYRTSAQTPGEQPAEWITFTENN